MRSWWAMLVLAMVFWGCRQDFDITAPYREIPVVYGLLDLNDSVHYLRIQRGFVDSSLSALVKASRFDSLYYPDVLDVHISNDCTGQQWLLERIVADTAGITKEPGLFNSTANILYRFADRLDVNHRYSLHLLNRESGLEATSATGMVGPFTTIVPSPGYVVTWSGAQDDIVNLSWKPAENALVYELTCTFHWYDIPIGTNDSIPRQEGFTVFGNKVTGLLAPELNISHPFPSILLYEFIGRSVPYDTTVVRVPRFIHWHITAGGTALGMLIANQQVQDGITAGQSLTVYTNVENGLGIFSSRYTMEFYNLIGGQALDSLRNGHHTRHLGFR